MSTASPRPQLQIRQAQEDDASALCEIFNEAVQDREFIRLKLAEEREEIFPGKGGPHPKG